MKNISAILSLLLGMTLLLGGYDHVRIGFQQEEGELYVPTSFKEGPDGNIYVFDRKDQVLKVYSPQTGKFLGRIAKRGEGPGEYLRFGSFDFTDKNQLFFTEGRNGHRWITFMELSGKFTGVLKLHDTVRRGLYRARMLSGNRILAQVDFFGESKKYSGYYQNYYQIWLVIIDAEGKIGKTVIKRNFVFSIGYQPAGVGPSVPDFPDFLWDLTKDERVVFSEGNSNILQVYNLEGKIVARCKTPLEEAPEFTTEDLRNWRARRKKEAIKGRGLEFYKKYFSVMDKYKPLYGKKQVIDSISTTPSGNILIRETKRKDLKEYEYHLITPGGETLESIRTGAKSVIVSKNFILYTLEDEDEDISLYCMKVGGNDKKSILKLSRR